MKRAKLVGAIRRLCRSTVAGLQLLLCVLAVSPGVQAEETIRMGFYQGVRREMSRVDLRSAFLLWTQELAVTFKVPFVVTFYEDVGSLCVGRLSSARSMLSARMP
jgi:hypothetical protein